jgi:DNA-directed RNA polymerase omega subunit
MENMGATAEQMSESWPKNGPGVFSRFRAVVVASLRVKQLRRGSKPRIEPDGKKHKDTSIAMEEVRRGLINLAQLPDVQDPSEMGDLNAGVQEPPSAGLGLMKIASH